MWQFAYHAGASYEDRCASVSRQSGGSAGCSASCDCSGGRRGRSGGCQCGSFTSCNDPRSHSGGRERTPQCATRRSSNPVKKYLIFWQVPRRPLLLAMLASQDVWAAQ